MGNLVKFEISDMPEVLLVGKELRHSMAEMMAGDNPLPDFWGRCFADGTFQTLEAQSGFVCEYFGDAYAGVMMDWDNGDGLYSYIVGMLMNAGAEVPPGYVSRKLNAATVAVGWIQGKDTPDVCARAHELTEQALKADGRSCDKMAWTMELYACPRFTTPDENGNIILDYYIPLD